MIFDVFVACKLKVWNEVYSDAGWWVAGVAVGGDSTSVRWVARGEREGGRSVVLVGRL